MNIAILKVDCNYILVAFYFFSNSKTVCFTDVFYIIETINDISPYIILRLETSFSV